MPNRWVNIPQERRILSRFRRGDGCWEWDHISPGTGGYGVVRYNGRQMVAHRAVYEILVGPIPEGLTLDHLCRNRACVRPDHLEPVSMRENVLRGKAVTAEHAVKTHCPAGHLYDEANTYMGSLQGGRFRCRKCRACHRERERLRKARVRAGLRGG